MMRSNEYRDQAARVSNATGEYAEGSAGWHSALYVFLVFVFVTGGSSQQRGWTDAAAELMALPVLAIGLWRMDDRMASRVCLMGFVAMAAVALLPWLQLLPLGDRLWALATARAAMAPDLAAAGVSSHATTWSLIPSGSVRAGLSMLPAVALFVAVVGASSAIQRRLLVLCIALPIASLVLGFLQLGAPQDSLLNPYPQWKPSMAGTFANPNHQGTAMLVGLGICLAFAVAALGRLTETAHGFERRNPNPWPAIIAGATLLLGLPLTNSRAAVVIGVLLLVAAPLGMAATALRRNGQGRRGLIGLMLVAALAALGLSAATGWMKVDELEEVRWILRDSTFALAILHLPWGSGIGSFVPVYQQALPHSLLLPQYANAAHNDFAQVWLEAGWLGACIAMLALAALGAAAISHVRGRCGDRRFIWAALLGLFALFAHAGADYALRTPALMAVAAVLCGVLIAQGARDDWRRHSA